MRRSLAALLFGFASVFASLALSSFWLKLTAFSPDRTRDAAAVVLEDSEIREELAQVIASAVAPQLGQDPALIQQTVLQVAGASAGATLLADIVADSQARLIGERDEPVQITPEQIVSIVRDERAFAAPAITLPVEKVGALSVVRQLLTWLVPIAAGLALVLMLLGFAAHPEKAELLRSLGILLLGMALLLVIIGYAVPTVVLPLLTKNVWVGALPKLAADSLPLLGGMTLLLVGAGLGCLAGASASKRHDRWSQPIRRTSYREERRWS